MLEAKVKDEISIQDSSKPVRILILGSGFAGVEVLRRIQRKFSKKNNINITLVSRDNFLLFTPMLHEVSSGTIEMRHIVTPVRTFIKKANFYEANIQSIDLQNKKVIITHKIGKQSEPTPYKQHVLEYDYLVIALGSETSFFGMEDIKRHSFTMKTVDDAIILRNHALNILEQASLEQGDSKLRKSLLTFVIVGGGFGGVETVGELNDFIKETVKEFYKNIPISDIRIILINSHDKILPELGEELGNFALQKLKERGVQFIMNTHVKGATANTAKLDNGNVIPTFTLIWTAGVHPSEVISNLDCDHDRHHRIICNNRLELSGHEGQGVYALGDCASITDPHTGKPYPPTAQHAIRQGRIAAKNLISSVQGKGNKQKFNYKTKGMMAEIGKRTGVAKLFGFKIHGFTAWWLWRTFYLSNLPTIKKKLKVMGDWTADLLFTPDVAMVRGYMVSEKQGNRDKSALDHSMEKEKEKGDSVNIGKEKT
jgi:NADH:ubiquinone reductase (H+-translocating)